MTKNPTPAQIRAARLAADMTQTEAASVVYSTLRAWQHWEAGDRRMHPAVFELFMIKTRDRLEEIEKELAK